MNTTVFELNDTGIRCSQGSSDDNTLVSPGYALLTETGVATGVSAQQHFWLQPQRGYNQFWRQLSLSPLPSGNRFARHHADLAYAQLLQLHRDSGEPGKVIFAAPGSFSNEQLGILLGLAKASPFEVVGLVDSAVAATSQSTATGSILHLDIQLHQTIVTGIECTAGVRRTLVETLPELGLKHFHSHWAQYIANQFIRQYRYDPLHTASGEQQLNNLLPGWLSDLNGLDAIPVEMETPQGNYRLNLIGNELRESAAPLFKRLTEAVIRLQSNNAQLLLSHRCAQLPGFQQRWPQAQPLSPNATEKGCFAHLDNICTTGAEVNYITSLPGLSTPQSSPSVPETDERLRPTHLLFQYQAYSVNDELPAELHQLGLQFQQNKGALALTACAGDIQLNGNRDNIQTGDSLTLGNGEIIHFIEVI